MDPITDPRASDPIPAYLLAEELHRLRAEIHAARVALEVAAAQEPRPANRAALEALVRVFYRLLNASSMNNRRLEPAPTPAPVGWLRRVLRAIVG